MKDLCKLVDGTYFEIEADTLGDLNAFCESEEAAIALCEKFTPENTSTIEFYTQYEDRTPNELIIKYENVSMMDLPSRTTMGEGQVLVHLAFSVPDPIEEDVAVTKNDITDIQMALAEIYEILDGLMS